MPDNWILRTGGTTTVGGGGGTAPPADDVTDLIGRFEYIDKHDGKGLRLTLGVRSTAPTPLGSFAGVVDYIEHPDQSSGETGTTDGSHATDGTLTTGGEWAPVQGTKHPYQPGAEVLIEGLEPVTVQTPIRVYLNPYNTDDEENELVRANEPSATPSIVITVDPPPDGPPATGRAPLVTDFVVQTSGGHCNTYAANGAGQKALFVATAWSIPIGDFGGVSLLVIRGDGTHERLTQGIWNSGNDYRAEILNFPFEQEPVRIYALSANKANQLNDYAPGVTPYQDVILDPPPDGAAGIEKTSNVRLFDVGTPTYLPPNAAGQTGTCTIPIYYEPPPDSTWGGAAIFGIVPWQAEHVKFGAFQKDPVPLQFPYTPGDPQTWEIYALSQDVNGQANTYQESGANATPRESVTINPPPLGGAGTEKTSLVTTIAPAATIQTRKTIDGAEEWRLKLQWEPPNDVTFGQMRYTIERTSGTAEYVESEFAGNTGTVTYTKWRALIAGEVFTVWFGSVDVNNQENTLVAGVTPRVTGLSPTTTGGGLKGDRLEPGSVVTAAAFAATLKPPEVVSALPALPNADYPNGRLVFLTTDQKLYRNTSGTWNKSVDAVDVINAHLIIAGSVVSGAIGTAQLFAGELLLGQGGGKPTRFKIIGSAGSTVAFLGDDSSIPFTGIYTTRLKVAPTILTTSPRFELNGSLLEMEGGTFKLESSNCRTKIANDAISVPLFGSLPGMYLETMTGSPIYRSATVPGMFALIVGGANRAWLHALNDASDLSLVSQSGAHSVTVTANVARGAINIDGLQVLGPRLGSIAAPTGGAVQDNEARAAINAIRAVLTGHGATF